jgi:hypothetical protein
MKKLDMVFSFALVRDRGNQSAAAVAARLIWRQSLLRERRLAQPGRAATG